MKKIKIFIILILITYSIHVNGTSNNLLSSNNDSIKKHKLDTPIILKLKVNESCFIAYESKGCFHHFFDTLFITRTNLNYFAKWNTKTKILDSLDIKEIVQFDFFYQYKFGRGCTTIDNYSFHYQNALIRMMKDGSCQNMNFQYLIDKLFK